MTTSTDQQVALRCWGLAIFAVLLSAASAFSYLRCIGYGIAAGDLIGIRGREPDVALAQQWAKFWLMTSAGCLAVAGLAGALATPIYRDAPRVSRFIARLVVALVVSLVLAVLIGWAYFSIVTGSHHSVFR